LWTVIKGEKVKFPVTPKARQEGNFLHLVIPQIAIVVLTLLGALVSAWRVFMQGHLDELPVFIVNVFWGLNNICCMLPMIRSAMWTPDDEVQADSAHSPTLAAAAVAR
jgi:cellulose synthase (UDP-forming)